MISHQHKLRLRKTVDFFRQAKRTRITTFLVFSKEHKNSFGVAVIVPKRVVSLATERNRIKRLVYQLFNDKIKSLELLKTSLVLVLEKKTDEVQLKQNITQIISTIL